MQASCAYSCSAPALKSPLFVCVCVRVYLSLCACVFICVCVCVRKREISQWFAALASFCVSDLIHALCPCLLCEFVRQFSLQLIFHSTVAYSVHSSSTDCSPWIPRGLSRPEVGVFWLPLLPHPPPSFSWAHFPREKVPDAVFFSGFRHRHF